MGSSNLIYLSDCIREIKIFIFNTNGTTVINAMYEMMSLTFISAMGKNAASNDLISPTQPFKFTHRKYIMHKILEFHHPRSGKSRVEYCIVVCGILW